MPVLQAPDQLFLAASAIGVAETMEGRRMIAVGYVGELVADYVIAEFVREKDEQSGERNMAVGGMVCSEDGGSPADFPA